MSNQSIPFIIFLGVCHIIVLVIILIVIWKLIIRIFKKSSPNRQEKIAAAALTMALFNLTLKNALIIPIQSMVFNLQKLFYLAYEYNSLEAANENGQNKELLNKSLLNEETISVTGIFDNFPTAKLLLAISFFILIYYIIRSIKKSLDSGGVSNNPSVPARSVILSNYLVLVVLATSLFLVISVCITIPYLSQLSKPTVFTAAKLDSALSNYSSKDSFKTAELNTALSPNPFARDILINADTRTKFDSFPKYYQENIDRLILNLATAYSSIQESRQNVIGQLNRFSENFKVSQKRYKEELKINYEKASQSITADKPTIYQTSVRLFSDYVDNQISYFKFTLDDVRRNDIRNRGEIDRTLQDFKSAILANDPNKLKSDTNIHPFYFPFNLSLTPYNSYIENVKTNLFVPEIEKTGREWGVFGALAGYLIKTQSSDLVLLMGMFGFGLLGASLLSFRQTKKDEKFTESLRYEPLIPNFGNVLARGFGAALVVYLATKGGLAIFSAGETTDANGYILLLSCFIAAIYSEKVWNRIQRQWYGDERNDNQQADPRQPRQSQSDQSQTTPQEGEQPVPGELPSNQQASDDQPLQP